MLVWISYCIGSRPSKTVSHSPLLLLWSPHPSPAAFHERGVAIFPTTCESAGPGLSSSLIPSSTTPYQQRWSPCCSCCSHSRSPATAPLLRSISHGSRQLSLFLDLWSHVTLSESSPLTTLSKTATLSAFSMPLKVCFSAPEVLFCHYCHQHGKPTRMGTLLIATVPVPRNSQYMLAR